MTDASGYVIESTEYMPFGSVRSHSGANTSDYKYTDQELDAENGLYNYNARLYDPFIGRFISPDTIVPEPFNPQSLNRYSYCLNNPLIYVDPSGHKEITPDEWAACMAMWEYINSLNEVWPQMGGSLAYEMGFMDPVTSTVDYWNLDFERYNNYLRWKKVGNIVKNILPNIEKGNMVKVEAIVLHSTDGTTATGAIDTFKSTGKGTHYIIDKEGTVYQTANLEKYTSHVGPINSKSGYTSTPWSAKAISSYEKANKNYPQRYPTSQESIGIEIVRDYTASKGWEAATQAQLVSLDLLVSYLQVKYDLVSIQEL